MLFLRTWWHHTSSLLVWRLLLSYSDIIEYSLPKILEELKISNEEVKKTTQIQYQQNNYCHNGGF